MKVTLKLADGREMDFSEVKNISVLKEHSKIKNVILENDIEIFEEHCEIRNVTQEMKEFAQVPTEGKWFKVNPLAIDKNLFNEKRKDLRQEKARKRISEAFEEVKKNPKYAKQFKTLMPEKTWEYKTVFELIELAKSLGDHNADWVEQALEWAQRIANGESWEDICDKPDTAKWYRLVVGKIGYVRLVGGSCMNNNDSASEVCSGIFFDFNAINCAVPLVVAYDE